MKLWKKVLAATVTAVEIPAEINGCPVTSIEDAAFRRCSNLTDITIPESITYIGKEAFSYTPWLKARQAENPLVIVNHIVIHGQTCTGNVVIPDGVTSIANYAFSSDLGLATACSTQMTSVTIPDTHWFLCLFRLQGAAPCRTAEKYYHH